MAGARVSFPALWLAWLTQVVLTAIYILIVIRLTDRRGPYWLVLAGMVWAAILTGCGVALGWFDGAWSAALVGQALFHGVACLHTYRQVVEQQDYNSRDTERGHRELT